MNTVNRYKVAALVPMRHSSERIPGKNYREFAGKPLFHHILESLSCCEEIGEIVVDTDSDIIRTSTREAFPAITIIERPENLRDGMVPMNDVLLHTTSLVDADFYLQTHCTNPLLSSETISKAVRLFVSNVEKHDSMFSVTRRQSRFWDQDGKAVNHNPTQLLRTQDLPPIYEENSCLYMFSRESLVARKNRIGGSPLMFEIDPIESWDIDEETDFEIAEVLFLNRHADRKARR